MSDSPGGHGPEAHGGNRLCQPVAAARRQCIPVPYARTVSAAVARSLRMGKKSREEETAVRQKKLRKPEKAHEAELPWTNYRRRCDGWSEGASNLQARDTTTLPAIRGRGSSQMADWHRLPQAA